MQLKRWTAAFVFLAAAVLVSAQAGFKPAWAAPKKVSPAAALQGVWTMTNIGGEAVSPKDPPLKIEFRPGKSKVGDYLITRGTDEVEAGEFRVTDTPDGLQIDFGPVMGENVGKIQHGIMKIEDAKLTWCMSPAGSEERPTAFANVTPDYASARGIKSDGTTVIEAMKVVPSKLAVEQSAPSLLERIQGNWTLLHFTGLTSAGVKEFTPEPLPVYNFQGQNWSISQNGRLLDKGQLTIDESSTPAQVVWSSANDGKPTTSHGVVELNNSTLRIRLGGEVSQFRPVDFEFRPGNEAVGSSLIHTLVRAESKVPATNAAPQVQAAGPAALQGTWTVTSVGGRSRGASERPMNFVFEGQEFRLEDGGMVMFMGQWKLGSDQDPMTIDIRLVGADRQPTGDLLQGLVEVRGNTLRLAMGDPNTPRPKSFNSSKDTDGVDSSLMIAEKAGSATLQNAGRAPAQMPAAIDRAPRLLDAIQGKWLTTEVGGGPIPDGPYVTTYDGEMWSIISPKHSAKGHISINDSVMPAQIDIYTDWGSWTKDPIDVVHGILESDGKTLKICTANPGVDFRPTTFENARPRGSIPGNDSTLAIYVRGADSNMQLKAGAPRAVTPSPVAHPTNPLQGTWKLLTIGGESPKSTATMTFVITSDELRWVTDIEPERPDIGQVRKHFEVVYHLQSDSSRMPMPVDLTVVKAEQNVGAMFRCLADVNGQTLRLCMGPINGRRPAEIKDIDSENEAESQGVFVAVRQ